MGRFTSSLAMIRALGRTNPLTRTERRGKLTPRPRRPQLLVEPLEPRTLLSSTPVANDDFADTDGQNMVRIAVLHNDSAQAGLNPHTVRIVSLPQNGLATVDFLTGDVFYRSVAPSFAGTDTFSYTVQDNNGATSNVARVSVVVNRPTANDDAADTDAGNPVAIDVLANDTDPDGPNLLDPATVRVVSSPAHGGTSVNASTGAITYTPLDGFTGTDAFTYTVTDVHGATSNVARVSVVVNRPTASDDFAQTTSGSPVLIDVLANDTDPDGPGLLNPASVSVAGSPLHGSTSVDPGTGAITYTPQGGFVGTDRFTYTVKDVANATSNPATVTVTVNQAAMINDDAADTDAGNAVIINVLGNDFSPNGFQRPSVTVANGPSHGSTTVNPSTGEITYTPQDGFAGTDTFTYTVLDIPGNTLGPARVSVVVNRPTANDDFTDTDAGNAVTIDVLGNDTDPDGPGRLKPASVTVATNPAHGVAVVDRATGEITYTPQDGFAGTDSFTYTVRDVANATSNPATVTVVVNRPTANDDAADTDGTNPVIIDVLGNDTDPDGPGRIDPTTVTVVSNPAHGVAVVDRVSGEVTYTAQPGFAGTDTFTYTVRDLANATSNPATVTVIVNRPTAQDDAAVTFGTNPVRIDVLANDSDPDGPGMLNPASVMVVVGPAHGGVTVDPASGAVTYTPAAGFSGVDTFGYTVTDFPGATSNVATVSVTVNPPTANPDSTATVGTTPVAIDVLANDTDPDGRGALLPGSVTVTGFPAHGRVLVDPATGQLTYTAFAGFFGVDQFTYTVADVHGSRSSPATVTVSVAHGPLPVVSQGAGGRLRILDPQTGGLLLVLRPYGRHFHGKLRVALGDVNGDGIADVIIGAAHGRRPLRLFNGQTGALLGTFPAPGTRKTDGVHVAAGDVNGDGFADVLAGAGRDGLPLATVLSGRDGQVLAALDAFPANFREGVRVAAGDVNGDGVADVLLLSRRRGHSLALAFSGVNGAPLGALTPAQIDRFFAGT